MKWIIGLLLLTRLAFAGEFWISSHPEGCRYWFGETEKVWFIAEGPDTPSFDVTSYYFGFPNDALRVMHNQWVDVTCVGVNGDREIISLKLTHQISMNSPGGYEKIWTTYFNLATNCE